MSFAPGWPGTNSEIPGCKTSISIQQQIESTTMSTELTPQAESPMEFEKYPALSFHIERMANIPMAQSVSEWSAFLQELNYVLSGLSTTQSQLEAARKEGAELGWDAGIKRCRYNRDDSFGRKATEDSIGMPPDKQQFLSSLTIKSEE